MINNLIKLISEYLKNFRIDYLQLEKSLIFLTRNYKLHKMYKNTLNNQIPQFKMVITNLEKLSIKPKNGIKLNNNLCIILV